MTRHAQRTNRSPARPILLVWAVAGALGLPQALSAQASDGQEARAEDVASPEAIVLATYEAIGRAPNAPYDWARFRTLFRNGALLVPNVQQTGGKSRVLGVEEFIRWIEQGAPPGAAGDRGFSEDQVHARTERFGAIAHVWSTYEKRWWGEDERLGMGINSFQLVHVDGRWWITAIAWDEERPGLTIPRRDRGSR